MSAIIVAREKLVEERVMRNEAMRLLRQADALHEEALALMTRQSSGRRATPVRVTITPEMRREIMRMYYDRSMTYQDIAVRLGLRNAGRISEVIKQELKKCARRANSATASNVLQLTSTKTTPRSASRVWGVARPLPPSLPSPNSSATK